VYAFFLYQASRRARNEEKAAKSLATLAKELLGQRELGMTGFATLNDPLEAVRGTEATPGLADDLDQLLFGLIHPRDVGEGDVEFVLHVDLRLVLAQGHEARLLAAHPFHQEIPDADEQQQREDPREEVAQEGGFDFTFEGDGILFEHCGEIRIDADRFEQLEVPASPSTFIFPWIWLAVTAISVTLPAFRRLRNWLYGMIWAANIDAI